MLCFCDLHKIELVFWIIFQKFPLLASIRINDLFPQMKNIFLNCFKMLIPWFPGIWWLADSNTERESTYSELVTGSPRMAWEDWIGNICVRIVMLSFNIMKNGFQHHWVEVGPGSNILRNEVAQFIKKLITWLLNPNL